MRNWFRGFASASLAGMLLKTNNQNAALVGSWGPLGRSFPLLFFGVFVLHIPTIFATHMSRHKDGEFSWKEALSGCRPWMRTALYAVWGYTVVCIATLAILSHAPVGKKEPLTPKSLRDLLVVFLVLYGTQADVMYSEIVRRPE